MVQVLLEAGLDVNRRSPGSGATPLVEAVLCITERGWWSHYEDDIVLDLLKA